MARTKNLPIPGRKRDSSMPPRVPKKETTIERSDVVMKKVCHITFENGPECKIMPLGEEIERDRTLGEWRLNWQTCPPEETQGLWAESVIFNSITSDTAELISSRFNEMNIVDGIIFENCSETVIRIAVECFCPHSVYFPEGNKKEIVSGEIFLHNSFQHTQKFYVANLSLSNPLSLEFLNERTEFATVRFPMSCSLQIEPIKRVFEAWVNRITPLQHLLLEFSEEFSVFEAMNSLLSNVGSEIIWEYSQHEASLIKDMDIEKLNYLPNRDAIALSIKQKETNKEGVVFLDKNSVYFEVVGDFTLPDTCNNIVAIRNFMLQVKEAIKDD